MFLRGIDDIQIVDGKIGVFRNIGLSIEQLEEQISLLPYSGSKGEIDKLVENTLFPPFIQAFLYLFFKNRRVPDENYLFDTYISWLGQVEAGKVRYDNVEYNAEGIRSRMLRAYPSFIRDLHLYYLLQNSKRFDKVFYSLKNDYYHGLDIGLIHEGTEFFLSAFIQTTRGSNYKAQKYRRHNYDGVNEIVLPLNFDELKKAGKIFLVSDKQLNNLINNITNR